MRGGDDEPPAPVTVGPVASAGDARSTSPLSHRRRLPPAAVICDLDGTLVDSRLDFQAIRAEMGIEGETSVLAALDRLESTDAARCRAILDRHELAGAMRARLFPGVPDFLGAAAALGLKSGLFTRNSRVATATTLRRCGLAFDRVLTREDGPPKPDPWAIHALCREWELRPEQVLVFGDFHYDLAAGRAAGAVTVLVCQDRPHTSVRGHELADFCLASFADHARVSALLRGLSPAPRLPAENGR